MKSPRAIFLSPLFAVLVAFALAAALVAAAWLVGSSL